jgi:hypothetical protein
MRCESASKQRMHESITCTHIEYVRISCETFRHTICTHTCKQYASLLVLNVRTFKQPVLQYTATLSHNCLRVAYGSSMEMNNIERGREADNLPHNLSWLSYVDHKINKGMIYMDTDLKV